MSCNYCCEVSKGKILSGNGRLRLCPSCARNQIPLALMECCCGTVWIHQEP